MLSKYVVLTRMVPGCRNVDLCASVTSPGRLLIVQKWDDAAAQRAALRLGADGRDGRVVQRVCSPGPPDIDLWDGLSAHDLS